MRTRQVFYCCLAGKRRLFTASSSLSADMKANRPSSTLQGDDDRRELREQERPHVEGIQRRRGAVRHQKV